MQTAIQPTAGVILLASAFLLAVGAHSATFETQLSPQTRFSWKGLGEQVSTEPSLLLKDSHDVVGYGYTVSPHSITAEGWALAGSGGASYKVTGLVARIVPEAGEQIGDSVTVYIHYKARIRNALVFTNSQALVVQNSLIELYRQNLFSGDHNPVPIPVDLQIGDTLTLTNIGVASFSQTAPAVSVDTVLQISFCAAGPPDPPIAGEGVCGNGLDDDNDGLVDLDDPGCEDSQDDTEYAAGLPCDDGIDNDGDCSVDFGGGDPGCRDPLSPMEDPACQDGQDNDSDFRIDFDGGQSLFGQCSGGVCPNGVSDVDGDGNADPDLHCAAPWIRRESPRPPGCGLGGELALLIPALLWWARRRDRM